MGARFLGEAGRLWMLSETIIPDELSVVFRGRRATISGTGQHETIRFEGKAAGHFGKGVLFQQPPQEGLLVIDHPPTSGRAAYKAVFVVGSRAVALEPLNIEPGEVYTWSVDVERPGRTRRQVRFRLLRGEETVHELVAPPGATTFGFVATVRHRGDRAGLTVSFK